MASGPLDGLRVVEMGGIGPAPLAVTMLSDMGAEVIRIDRKTGPRIHPYAGTKLELDGRGRRSITLDLKHARGTDACLALIERADILVEGFRPGVMERLGLGPDVALKRNPKLVYGRMTGWGQDGPYALNAGHDLNYIAISGAAMAIGSREQPLPPLNYVGDDVGALMLVSGVLAALHHARASGEGQVVDAAMCEAASYVSMFFHAAQHAGQWSNERGVYNEADGGAPFYGAYGCADGQWVSVAPAEPHFYAELLSRLELPDSLVKTQRDRSTWAETRRLIADRFKQKTRQQWCDIFEGSNACFAPMLHFGEAPSHAQYVARGHFVTIDDVVQPGPTPRFSRTPGAVQGPPPAIGADGEAILVDWGFDAASIAVLSEQGVI